ncbi:hypothetical protein [Mesorhizobium sp.]|uniref:hypothetical protein n=1 Tax=Mesorhizobium sp. TaxID=1871066 RepID=UPI002589D2B8|nr:hypothetical protein [Mesorhizobium sp.]
MKNDGAHVLDAGLTAQDGGAQRLVEILAAVRQHRGARMGFTVFFTGHRAFDAAGMDADTECRMQQLRQGSRL